jgi:hypothetical protein
MAAPEKIYTLYGVYATKRPVDEPSVEYIRADLHNDHVASAWRSNGKLMDKIDIMQRRIDGLIEERDALRNGMAKFTMDTLGEMVKFSPPPPIHLTVTQEQADKIIAELEKAK